MPAEVPTGVPPKPAQPAANLLPMTESQRAWADLLGALPKGWRLGQLTLHHEDGLWRLVAIGPPPARRRQPPDQVLAMAASEVLVVRQLRELLDRR